MAGSRGKLGPTIAAEGEALLRQQRTPRLEDICETRSNLDPDGYESGVLCW